MSEREPAPEREESGSGIVGDLSARVCGMLRQWICHMAASGIGRSRVRFAFRFDLKGFPDRISVEIERKLSD